MPTGTFKPEEMKEGFIVAPVVALYSPIVLLKAFVTNRFPPDTAIPFGEFTPEMKAGLIVAPVVALYAPIVLLPSFATNRFPPDNTMPSGPLNPEEMKELLIVAPVVALYSPIVLLPLFLFARRIHEIHFRIKEIDIADESAIEESAPLHRKINQRRRKQRHRDMASRLYDLDMVDLVSAAPKMHRHGRDKAAIFRHFG